MRMTGTGLGEREIIQQLTKRFLQSRQKLPLGFDDDVAAYPMSSQHWLILKTDSLVGSTDIPPGMSLKQAARKAVVATVSDFAAKGVQPEGLLISLALHSPVRPSMVNELANGIYEASREYHCNIIGGDTGESTDLVIDCIGFGFAEPRRILRRDGARPGDIIAVTGNFGGTSAGLRILLSKSKTLARKFPRLVYSVTHPVARLDTGLMLADSMMVNSSIDSSDGLAWSLYEIARLSRASMVLERIPLAREAETYAGQQGLSPEELALYGGEEYELIVTIPSVKFSALKRMVPSLIRIGRVERGRGDVLLRSQGRIKEIEPRGWEHMRSQDPSAF
jgi:thiamine-monophosphate kinase